MALLADGTHLLSLSELYAKRGISIHTRVYNRSLSHDIIQIPNFGTPESGSEVFAISQKNICI
jgi:hypothetical protein